MEIIPVTYELSTVIMDLWNVLYFRAKEKELKPSVELIIACEYQDKDNILLKISVKDTGMGIRKEDMGKLFESFQRMDEKKNRNIEGTGLGMNITMSLLKMMGGDMKVESEYRKGSTFQVIIPQKIVRDVPLGSFQAIQEKNSQLAGRKKESFTAPRASILVVDDNAMNLTVFKALLKRTKLRVTTADSGRQCLEYIQKKKFHIIFMDRMMPEMDGIETLHKMNEIAEHKNNETPVIELTANAVAGAREQYLSEGFCDFLTKPIDAELMEQTICEYLPQELILSGSDDGGESGEAGEEYDAYLKEGISVKNGLQHAQNSMDIYLELVRLFIKDKKKIKQMGQYLPDHNMQSKTDREGVQEGNVMELPQERLDEMAALIDAFHTEEAVKQIKKWLKKPLQSGRRQLLKDVLSAIEDEFDEDQAIELLKGENEK